MRLELGCSRINGRWRLHVMESTRHTRATIVFLGLPPRLHLDGPLRLDARGPLFNRMLRGMATGRYTVYFLVTVND